jgi:Holliday junction resolvase
MTAIVDRSRIGRSNRNRGAKAERDVARWFRDNGWTNAERKSDNGWKTADRESADRGDIRGLDRLVIQVKYLADMTDLAVANAMAAAVEQAVAAGADYGILVQRRVGKASPGQWWAWMSAWDLHTLVAGRHWPVPPSVEARVPVRMQLQHLVPLLHAAGYGTSTAVAS